MAALVINDIDAGLGHFANTQITVNNQVGRRGWQRCARSRSCAGVAWSSFCSLHPSMPSCGKTQLARGCASPCPQIVVGSLMNICDNPKQVSVMQAWRDDDLINRVPIIVTGNDFTTLFAPLVRLPGLCGGGSSLASAQAPPMPACATTHACTRRPQVRDGRMEKFYWNPSLQDKVEIVHQMYKDDGLSMADVEKLLRRFSNQGLDFFGHLRSSTYDNQIRDWIVGLTGERPFPLRPANAGCPGARVRRSWTEAWSDALSRDPRPHRVQLPGLRCSCCQGLPLTPRRRCASAPVGAQA